VKYSEEAQQDKSFPYPQNVQEVFDAVLGFATEQDVKRM